MADTDDMLENMVSAVMRDLEPMIDEAGIELELTVPQVVEMGKFLCRAWVAGAKAGQAEIMAQAIEKEADDNSGGFIPDDGLAD